jgi:3D (Asp-Asp-Asp) domain-containing protein
MNKVISKIIKTSKFLLLLIVVFGVQKVNVVSSVEKISNENLNKTLDLTAMAVKVNEIAMSDKYYALDTFTGDLTGYVANCPACSGYLACNGEYMVNKDAIYNDSEYGEVLIVASSKNLACGSIVSFDSLDNSGTKSIAIVLDRGVLGNDLDLLVNSKSEAVSKIGRRKISYDVIRNGWTR